MRCLRWGYFEKIQNKKTFDEEGFFDGPDYSSENNSKYAVQQPVIRETAKIGRNDPCSCGSGKKFKKCCG